MKNKNRLKEEKISKLLLEYSIPAVMGTLVYILYNIVDRIFISFGVGRLAIAGLSITLPMFAFILAVGLFIGVGGGALISINLGAGREEEAELVLGNAVALFGGMGVLMALLGTVFLDDILRIFGATPQSLPYAYDYMKVILYALPFQLCFIGLNHIIRGEGNPRIAMKASIIGCGLNIILDPIFIFVMDMGITGAALATVISNCIVAVMQLQHFITGENRRITLKLKNMVLQKSIIKKMSNIGIAPFIMQMSNSVVVIFINKNLNIYGGDIAIAAYGIINSINVLFFMPIIGMYQGSQPILGFNYGAKEYGRVRETFKLTLKIAIGISLTAFTLAMFVPHILIAPFINDDPELLNLTISSLRIVFSMVFCVGFHVIGGSYFQAVGRAKITTILNIVRQLVLMIPMVYILPKYYGVNGVWLATPVTDLTLAIITLFFVRKEFVRLKEVSNKENGVI